MCFLYIIIYYRSFGLTRIGFHSGRSALSFDPERNWRYRDDCEYLGIRRLTRVTLQHDGRAAAELFDADGRVQLLPVRLMIVALSLIHVHTSHSARSPCSRRLSWWSPPTQNVFPHSRVSSKFNLPFGN